MLSNFLEFLDDCTPWPKFGEFFLGPLGSFAVKRYGQVVHKLDYASYDTEREAYG
jgi:hypothetical protein